MRSSMVFRTTNVALGCAALVFAANRGAGARAGGNVRIAGDDRALHR